MIITKNKSVYITMENEHTITENKRGQKLKLVFSSNIKEPQSLPVIEFTSLLYN